MPYAKTVRSAKKLHGVKPDPGMLFDLLQARTSETFKENEAGISSMFLYHADILIHGKLNLFSVKHQVLLHINPVYKHTFIMSRKITHSDCHACMVSCAAVLSIVNDRVGQDYRSLNS